jgi:hypothetical protein
MPPGIADAVPCSDTSAGAMARFLDNIGQTPARRSFLSNEEGVPMILTGSFVIASSLLVYLFQ